MVKYLATTISADILHKQLYKKSKKIIILMSCVSVTNTILISIFIDTPLISNCFCVQCTHDVFPS